MKNAVSWDVLTKAIRRNIPEDGILQSPILLGLFTGLLYTPWLMIDGDD
jgi:hypothetical protein